MQKPADLFRITEGRKTIMTPNSDTYEPENEESWYLLWRQNKNRSALEKLLTGIYSFAYCSAYKICRNHAFAEEIVQETFIVLTKSNQYTGGSFRSWVYRIVVNQTKNLLRSEKNIAGRMDPGKHLERIKIGFTSETTPEGFSRREELNPTLSSIVESINSIDQKFRVPLLLFLVGKMKRKLICKHLNLTLDQVSYRIHKGLTLLQHHLRNSKPAERM